MIPLQVNRLKTPLSVSYMVNVHCSAVLLKRWGDDLTIFYVVVLWICCSLIDLLYFLYG